MTFSPDPEIRLRQKYDPSNRPFEDSLFVEVDKVQADGFHRDSESTSKHAGYLLRPQERGIGQPEQDICANKHHGDPASKDANLRISASKREICQQILKFAMLNGSHGITLNEVVSHLGLKVQTASARLSELRRDGVLVPKGDIRREHCSVLIPR